jgi:uncharacterized protein YjbI with pentapeptide repeats
MSTAVVVSLALVAVAAAAFIAAAYVRRWEWAGFAGSPSSAQGPKTVWDWLQLLVIPLGLAAVAFALNIAQSGREQRREDRRAALERSIASDRRREDALGVYLQQMSALMLERGLLTSREGSQSRAIARTLTLSVFRRLDGRRKGFVVQFLGEARLIAINHPKISMRGADLRHVTVRGSLENANLVSAALSDADFRGSDLSRVAFDDADLRRANFDLAFAQNVAFGGADLTRATFSRAWLWGASFSDACLKEVRFARATLDDTDFTVASGRDVDFSDALLRHVDLRPTELVGINLTGTRFHDGSSPPNPNQDPRTQDAECAAHG